MRRGLEQARAGDVDGALETLSAALADALKAKESAAASHIARHMGVLCDRVGDSERALGAIRSALEINPDDARLLFALADLESRCGEPARAAELFDRCFAAAIDRNDTDLLELLRARHPPGGARLSACRRASARRDGNAGTKPGGSPKGPAPQDT
jgi:tetratricopeptide (TPR) repeat protein